MAKARDDFQQAAGGKTSRRRSGSEKRQREKPRSIRFTLEENQRIADMEKSTGLKFASLVRHGLFQTPPPRASRRLSIDQKALTVVLAQLGKIGGNVNQLAKQANIGNFHTDDINMAMRDLSELRTVLLEALGFDRDAEESVREEAP